MHRSRVYSQSVSLEIGVVPLEWETSCDDEEDKGGIEEVEEDSTCWDAVERRNEHVVVVDDEVGTFHRTCCIPVGTDGRRVLHRDE